MIATLTIDNNTWELTELVETHIITEIKKAICNEKFSSHQLVNNGFDLQYDSVRELSDVRITPEYFMTNRKPRRSIKDVLWFCLCILFENGDACSLSIHARNRHILFSDDQVLIPVPSIGINAFNPNLTDNQLIQLKMMALKL